MQVAMVTLLCCLGVGRADLLLFRTYAMKKGVWPSGPKKERVMTMVILFLSSVESCGGDHR